MNTSHIGRVAFLLVLVAAIGGFSGHANGAVLTFQDNYEFSGGTAPVGTPPWLTTTISDVSTGVVNLTFTATGLTGNEHVGGLYLNVDLSLNPDFGFQSQTGTFVLPGINLGPYEPDGGGFFDILIAFTPTGDTFGPGDSITYRVIGTDALNAMSFNLPSAPGGAHGTWNDAVEVLGIGTNSATGYVTQARVPEPATLSLLVLGGLGLALLRRRKE